jgi:hypothetical protein
MEIVTVNYNTPDLLDNLITNIRLVSDLPIRVIDGSDSPVLIKTSKAVADMHEVEILQLGWNIHHGGGMNHAMETTTHDWVLMIDSDSQIKDGLLEALTYTLPYQGFGMQVNQHGINVPKGILYLHPHFLLVNSGYYSRSPYKFIKHGAPAIQIMANIPDDHKAVIPEEYQQYFSRGGRGTVNRFGYNL